MGSSFSSPNRPSAEFLAAFRVHADPGGAMAFNQFMALALYDPAVGYYRQNRRRIGYGAGTDFFTASTSGAIFGELVAAACRTLLADGDPRDFTFVEIGAEPAAPGHGGGPGGVLAGVDHPFGATRIVHVGEPPALAGKCVVFSNELFDAQPFRRFVARPDGWRELGVALRADRLEEVDLPLQNAPALPENVSTGYVLDAPLAARALAEQIAAGPWTGLFVACDYGKSWRELTEAAPAGTARAYYQHTQSNELLARPGQQDLTCHVCWDWLEDALQQHGFSQPILETQETFFIRHAGEFIATTSAAEAARFSRKKLALLQVLHPAHLGQKFQVLHARR